MENVIINKAFISCSLRNEDTWFIDLVERIVCAHNFQPFGTVGKYSASPENPAELMRRNIPLADIIVIAATPRYFQQDIQTGKVLSGLSEMLHVESGIAFAWNKPIIVFVQEGTDVGNFIPNITQYIVLNGSQEELNQKWKLINSIFLNAQIKVNGEKQKQSANILKNFVVGGLAMFGIVKAGQYLFDE